MEVVIVESVGNQPFVYATASQRENVGASQAVRLVGRWATEEAADDPGLVVVTAGSGKAIVLAMGDGSKAAARRLVGAVTLRAAAEGAGVHLAVSVTSAGAADLADLRPQEALLARAHHDLEQSAFLAPRPAGRWPQMPFLAVCPVSALPASPPSQGDPAGYADAGRRLSEMSRAKRRLAPAARKEMTASVGAFPHLAELERFFDTSTDDMAHGPEKGALDGGAVSDGGAWPESTALERAERLRWVGVVHADVNGLGERLSRLAGHVPTGYEPVGERAGAVMAADGRLMLLAYLADLADAVERCVQAAWKKAAMSVASGAATGSDGDGEEGRAMLVPVVLAGDDVTFLAPGDAAIDAAAAFLSAFDEAAGEDPVCGPLGLSVAAGVALVKRSFPFSVAYGLAGELCHSAKTRSRRCSMLDFHVLYDSTVTGLEALRRPLRSPDLDLTARPYRVGRADWPDPPVSLDVLRAAVGAISAAGDDGERFMSRATAVAFADRLRDQPAAWAALDESLAARPGSIGLRPDGSLLVSAGSGRRATLILDALDAEGLLDPILPSSSAVASEPGAVGGPASTAGEGR